MDGDEAPDASVVKYLKTLVTVLTLTMIVGLVTIVALFVMRFSEAREVTFPERITLPDGAVATAFTQGETWYAVVTEDDEILIYSRLTGALSQRIRIEAD